MTRDEIAAICKRNRERLAAGEFTVGAELTNEHRRQYQAILKREEEKVSEPKPEKIRDALELASSCDDLPTLRMIAFNAIQAFHDICKETSDLYAANENDELISIFDLSKFTLGEIIERLKDRDVTNPDWWVPEVLPDWSPEGLFEAIADLADSIEARKLTAHGNNAEQVDGV